MSDTSSDDELLNVSVLNPTTRPPRPRRPSPQMDVLNRVLSLDAILNRDNEDPVVDRQLQNRIRQRVIMRERRRNPRPPRPPRERTRIQPTRNNRGIRTQRRFDSSLPSSVSQPDQFRRWRATENGVVDIDSEMPAPAYFLNHQRGLLLTQQNRVLDGGRIPRPSPRNPNPFEVRQRRAPTLQRQSSESSESSTNEEAETDLLRFFDGRQCHVCETRFTKVTFVPCAHKVCRRCYRRFVTHNITTCHMCRTPIEDTVEDLRTRLDYIVLDS